MVKSGLIRRRRMQQRRIRNWILLSLLIAVSVLPRGAAAQPKGSNQKTSETEATFEESEASFEERSTGAGGGNDEIARLMRQAKDKFNIKLYLDFMYEQSLGEDENTALRDAENGSFTNNHSYLLITANPTEKLRIGFDIQFNEYYEIEYAVTPTFFVKGGLIFLPFGDFKYHAAYGGKVYSINNDLFPNWFTDYGMAIEHDLLDTDNFHLRYGAFISNGFQEGLGDVNMNTIGYSSDNNDDKAIGGRIKGTVFGGYSATASAMFDTWADDGSGTLRLYAFDLATVRGLANLPLLRNINLKLGYLDNHVENSATTDPNLAEYNAYGLNGELSIKTTDWLKLAFRAGEVDPNENIDDEMDQRNYSGIAIFSVDEHLHFWAMYQRNEEKYVDEIENDYVMVKAIVEF